MITDYIRYTRAGFFNQDRLLMWNGLFRTRLQFRMNNYSQGNFLKGIDKKTIRREGIEERVLFSVTHYLQGNKMVWNCIFYI